MKQKTRRRLQNVGVAILLLLCLAWEGSRFWGFASSTFTDNARVEQLIVPVHSRVQGFIKEVRFADYTPVKRGDTLVVIDDAEHVLALARARADLANASSGRTASTTAVGTRLNDVGVTDAAIAEVEALLANARADLDRHTELLARDAVTRQQYDAVKANHDALAARRDMLRRQRASTSMTAGEQQTRLGQNEAAVESAQAAVNMAALNLSYCVVTAPCDGFTARCDIHAGELVQPGQLLAEIVDSSDVWVTANYKEKQLKGVQPGDSVAISVDALPGVKFKGVVENISAATGSAYTKPAHADAVGNFVKVQQRVPVKIRFAASTPRADLERLRAGMNVECRIAR